MKLCWLYQTALAWSKDPQAPAAAWVKRHLRVCPRCRRFDEEHSRVAAALAASAQAQVTDPPPFLRARILSTLKAESSRSVEPIALRRWAGAALVSAFSLFIMIAFFVNRPGPHPARLNPAGSATEAWEQWKLRISPDQLLAWTERVDQPLENELNSVASDAKSALASLAGNFLPEPGAGHGGPQR
jgi:hypothetical protein